MRSYHGSGLIAKTMRAESGCAGLKIWAEWPAVFALFIAAQTIAKEMPIIAFRQLGHRPRAHRPLSLTNPIDMSAGERWSRPVNSVSRKITVSEVP